MKCNAIIGPNSVGSSQNFDRVIDAEWVFKKYLYQSDHFGLADIQAASMDVTTSRHNWRYTLCKSGFNAQQFSIKRVKLDY